MKVRFLRTIGHAAAREYAGRGMGVEAIEGQSAEVPDDIASELIAANLAEVCFGSSATATQIQTTPATKKSKGAT